MKSAWLLVITPQKSKKACGTCPALSKQSQNFLNNFTFYILGCFMKIYIHIPQVFHKNFIFSTVPVFLSKRSSVNVLLYRDGPHQTHSHHLNGLHLLFPQHPGCRTGNTSTWIHQLQPLKDEEFPVISVLHHVQQILWQICYGAGEMLGAKQ